MFRPAVTAAGRLASRRVAPQATRRFSASSIPPEQLNQWYNMFGKSTALYASWLVGLIVVGEFVTGKLTDGLWLVNNYGKTFTTVDWSAFDEFEEEGAADDDEDEEDEDDDDDDE